jgi:hypothetical protein
LAGPNESLEKLRKPLFAGIYGTAQMRVDAEINDFIPESSYLKDSFAVLQDSFGKMGTSVSLYWVNNATVRFLLMSVLFAAGVCNGRVLQNG